MTDDNDDYRPPRDAKGRFLPGFPGNTKGRPPKAGRSHVPDQLQRDVINEFEREVSIGFANGRAERMPAALALLRFGIGETLKTRNLKDILSLLSIHRQALFGNERDLGEDARILKRLEGQYYGSSKKEQYEQTPRLAWWRARTKRK